MTAERKAELRARLARFHTSGGNDGPTATGRELLDALDAAEAEIERLKRLQTEHFKSFIENIIQVEAMRVARQQAACECAEIADAQKQEWIRPSEGARPLPECAHACHLVAMKIRERFGLEAK